MKSKIKKEFKALQSEVQNGSLPNEEAFVLDTPLTANLELGDWDMPDDIWQTLEEKTRPAEDYLTFFNRINYDRLFSAAEFHDETAELP